jgi:hypothetical protein
LGQIGYAGGALCDERLDGTENAGGQREERADELKYTADGDANDAKGKKDEPDEGIEDERQERHWPADDEEDAEEK